MPVKLYSWDDDGAPVLGTTTDGSLLSILRACLVDGYGTRTAAGWSMPHSDLPNKKAVFAPVSGGALLRLDDNLNYQYAKVAGFDAMTDVDTGTGEFPTKADLNAALTYSLFVSKRGSTGIGYDQWHVIADDEWFYFVTHYPTNSYPGGFFFGAIDHVDPTFSSNFLITGYSTISSMSASLFPHSIINSGTGSWWMKENYYLTGVAQRVDTTRDDNVSWINPNPITGKIEIGVMDVRTDYTPYVRLGRQPNMFRALGASMVIYPTGVKVVLNSIKYVTLRYGTVCHFLEYDVETG